MDIAYLADDSAKHNTLVVAQDRIEEVAKRRTDLDEDESLTARLGSKYWDVERKYIEEVETRIAHRARTNGFNIPDHRYIVFYALQEYAKH